MPLVRQSVTQALQVGTQQMESVFTLSALNRCDIFCNHYLVEQIRWYENDIYPTQMVQVTNLYNWHTILQVKHQTDEHSDHTSRICSARNAPLIAIEYIADIHCVKNKQCRTCIEIWSIPLRRCMQTIPLVTGAYGFALSDDGVFFVVQYAKHIVTYVVKTGHPISTFHGVVGYNYNALSTVYNSKKELMVVYLQTTHTPEGSTCVFVFNIVQNTLIFRFSPRWDDNRIYSFVHTAPFDKASGKGALIARTFHKARLWEISDDSSHELQIPDAIEQLNRDLLNCQDGEDISLQFAVDDDCMKRYVECWINGYYLDTLVASDFYGMLKHSSQFMMIQHRLAHTYESEQDFQSLRLDPQTLRVCVFYRSKPKI